MIPKKKFDYFCVVKDLKTVRLERFWLLTSFTAGAACLIKIKFNSFLEPQL